MHLVIAEWRDPGGPQAHRVSSLRHIFIGATKKRWYVLEGTLCVRVGKEVVEASAGAAVFVPRGTPHTYWNPGPDPVRYLLINDRQHLSFDSGNPRQKERTLRASRRVCKIRLDLLDE